MAEDRYTALLSAMGNFDNKTEDSTFRDTIKELPNNMELGAFIRKWINSNPTNGLNINYLNTKKL